MVDIHNRARVFDRRAEQYVSRLFPEDREDVKRFINDFFAQGYSVGRVDKYLSSLVSIRKKLDNPFNAANTGHLKSFVAQLEKSDYTEWTKYHFLK